MSAASAALATGFTSLLGYHGETFSYTPASDVVLSDSGEAVSDEAGSPVLGGNVAATNVQLIFDAEYLLIQPGDVGIAQLAPVGFGRASDLSGVRKNAVFVRALDSARYVVQDIQPDGLEEGTTMLILSKAVH